jgi:hypothetical protein
MRRAEAPPAGWYPDPEGGTRLRWWEGEDWTPQYRAPPTPSELQRHAAAVRPPAPEHGAKGAPLARTDMEEVVSQVRQVARSEIDRAAGVFAQRAQAATRQVQPLISEYTTRITRILRISAIVVAVLLVAWFAFQAVAEVTFFEWLGDRIDRLTD